MINLIQMISLAWYYPQRGPGQLPPGPDPESGAVHRPD
jgi:hypothetical protein